MTDVADTRVETQTPPAPGATPGKPRACLHYLPLSGTGSARRARTGFRDRGPGSGTADRAPRVGGVAAPPRTGARDTHGGGAGVCHSATGCMHAYSARATYDRTYVDRLRVRSIDRSIKKNLCQPLTSRRRSRSHRQRESRKKKLFLPQPCGSCARTGACTLGQLHFRTIIFLLDDADSPPQRRVRLSAFTGSFEKVASRADEVK